MRQITKEFVTLIVAADPSQNDLVGGLTIHQRHAPSISAAAVTKVKGGLEVVSETDPFAIHLIDEDNIAALTLVLAQPAASDAGVHSIAQLLAYKPKAKAA